jgi:hypothetical protein
MKNDAINKNWNGPMKDQARCHYWWGIVGASIAYLWLSWVGETWCW